MFWMVFGIESIKKLLKWFWSLFNMAFTFVYSAYKHFRI